MKGSKKEKKIVILGGGVCGLYAALYLQRQGYNSIIIEKSSVTGGLATSAKIKGNFYDYGVHMFHAHDEEIYEDICQIMGDKRLEVDLNARILWQRKFYRYPLQFKDLVFGMNKVKLFSCVFGLFFSQIRYKLFPKKPRHSLDALNQLYGKPLTNFFFKEFTEKYWGIPTDKLSSTFVTTKMPRLTAVDVIKKLFSYVGFKEKNGMTVDSALSEEVLSYSKTGAETMVRMLSEEVVKNGGEIICNAEVESISFEGDEINEVGYKLNNGVSTKVSCDYCISTIPINTLVSSLDKGNINKVPSEVIKSSKFLRYKAIAIYGILVNKPKAIDGLYIYYRSHIFHRVCEPKNAGMEIDPSDHTVLIVEMTCDVGDKKWNFDQEVVDKMIEELEFEKVLKKEEVVDVNLIKYEHGYALYDLGFEEHLDKVKNYIYEFKNLESVGRQGGYCFPGMHKSMRIGLEAAKDSILFIDN